MRNAILCIFLAFTIANVSAQFVGLGNFGSFDADEWAKLEQQYGINPQALQAWGFPSFNLGSFVSQAMNVANAVGQIGQIAQSFIPHEELEAVDFTKFSKYFNQAKELYKNIDVADIAEKLAKVSALINQAADITDSDKIRAIASFGDNLSQFAQQFAKGNEVEAWAWFDKVKNAIGSAADTVKDKFNSIDFNGIANTVQNVVSKIDVADITSKLSQAADVISAVNPALGDKLQGVVNKIPVGDINNALTKAVDITNTVADYASNISSEELQTWAWFDKVKNALGNAVDTVKDKVGGAIDTVKDKVNSIDFKDIANTVQNVVSKIDVADITSKLSQAADVISAVSPALADKIQGAVSKIPVDDINNALSKAVDVTNTVADYADKIKTQEFLAL